MSVRSGQPSAPVCAMRMMNAMNRVEIRRLLVRAVYKSNRRIDDPIIDQMVELFVEQQDFYKEGVRQLKEAYETEIKRLREAFKADITSLRNEIQQQLAALNDAP